MTNDAANIIITKHFISLYERKCENLKNLNEFTAKYKGSKHTTLMETKYFQESGKLIKDLP